MFASFSTQFAKRLRALDPAWRWAVGVFVVARVLYTLWGMVVLLFVPNVLQNLDLFGVPIVAYFDVATSERYAYSRQMDDRVLTFRANDDATMTDDATSSVWSLREGMAVRGALTGTKLGMAEYTALEIFPYHGVAPAQNPLLAIWQRFDTNWFLKIAQRGYSSDDGSVVYFPLYPFLIRMLGAVLLGNDLLAALVISNLSLLGVLVLLYQFARELYGEAAARRAVVYLVMFPTAFFFLAAYTESLFLVLALASLYAARKNHFVWASVCAALAALTRLQGILLVLPLAYMVWKQFGARKFTLSRELIFQFAPLALVLLASFGFLAFTNLALISSYEGELHARFVFPWDNVWAAVLLVVQGHAGIADIANLVVTVLFGALCVVVWKTMPRELALYALLMFLAPLFRMTTAQPLVSMTRYVLVLFPIFMMWGAWGKNRWVERAIVYICAPLNLYFTAQFFIWGWIA